MKRINRTWILRWALELKSEGKEQSGSTRYWKTLITEERTGEMKKERFGGGKKRLETLSLSTSNKKITFDEEDEGNYVCMTRMCEACGNGLSGQTQTSRLTCNIWLASNAVPGSKMTGLDTWPDSTHTMLGNSSSPKSEISFAFSTHGFHTTGTSKCFAVRLVIAELTATHMALSMH
jgi:hypothetical protein